MIHVTATVTIVASNDEEATQCWQHLLQLDRPYPQTPIINITETERRLA